MTSGPYSTKKFRIKITARITFSPRFEPPEPLFRSQNKKFRNHSALPVWTPVVSRSRRYPDAPLPWVLMVEAHFAWYKKRLIN